MSSVTCAEVSQDGRCITSTDGSTVKFWDANHFELVKSYDMPCVVESASLEPKYGNKFIAGGEDTWIHVFDFHTGEEVGHHGPVHCLLFSPGGESYASGSEDGTIRIWQTDPSTHKELDFSAVNGKVKNGANEITRQMEKVDIAEEAKNDGSETAAVAN